MRKTGTHIHFNHHGKYGFIRPDEGGGEDIFVHISQFPPGVNVYTGDKVSYEEAEGKKGPEAIRLELIRPK